MIKEVMHIGLTVKDMDKSVAFYRDILGLKFVGELLMDGEETDALFNRPHSKARVAYLTSKEDIKTPPIELIQFLECETKEQEASLFTTGITEICFEVKDIDTFYKHLLKHHVVCLSKPQSFDFTKDGFGRSKAIYLRDPDGIILELMESL